MPEQRTSGNESLHTHIRQPWATRARSHLLASQWHCSRDTTDCRLHKWQTFAPERCQWCKASPCPSTLLYIFTLQGDPKADPHLPNRTLSATSTLRPHATCGPRMRHLAMRARRTFRIPNTWLSWQASDAARLWNTAFTTIMSTRLYMDVHHKALGLLHRPRYSRHMEASWHRLYDQQHAYHLRQI